MSLISSQKKLSTITITIIVKLSAITITIVVKGDNHYSTEYCILLHVQVTAIV